MLSLPAVKKSKPTSVESMLPFFARAATARTPVLHLFAFARTAIHECTQPTKSLAAPLHHVKEFSIVFCLPHLIKQKLHRLQLIHIV